MTSVLASYAQIPANKLYINVTSLTLYNVDSNNNVVPWLQAAVTGANYNILGAASTPGTLVLRDMGRNVYRPDPNLATAVGSQSTVLRRVQVVTSGTMGGYYGTGDGLPAGTGSDTDYYCGYISLGAQTYAGGNGVPSGVARLN